MIYRLIILNGSRKGEQITVPDEPMVLGKARDCSQSFPDDDMAQRHAEIRHLPTGIHIRDLGTMNKVLVNNRTRDESTLKHGDTIELGRTRLLVQAGVEAEVMGTELRFKRRRPSPVVILLPALLLAAMLVYWRHQLVETTPVAPATPALSTTAPPTAELPIPTPPAPPPATLPTPTSPATPSTPPTPAPVAILPTPSPTPPTPPGPDPATLAATAFDTRIAERLAEARTHIGNGQWGDADRLLESLQMLSTRHPEIHTERALLFEKRGMLIPAIEQWRLVRQADPDPDLDTKAAQSITRLGKGRTTPLPGFAGSLRISASEVTRFPSPDAHQDMRVLNITLQRRRDIPTFDPEGVQVHVVFFERAQDARADETRLVAASRATLPIEGDWPPGDNRTTSATYLGKAQPQQGSSVKAPPFYGYLLQATYFGAHQDLTAHPPTLLKQIDLPSLFPEPVLANTPSPPRPAP